MNYAKAPAKPSKGKGKGKGKGRDKNAPARYKKEYNLRDAVATLHPTRVMESAKELAGPAAAEKKGGFLGKYAAAVTEAMDKLTPQEKKEALNAVQKWNSEGLPCDLQAK